MDGYTAGQAYLYKSGDNLGKQFYPVALTANYTDSATGMQYRITDSTGTVLTGAALTAEVNRRQALARTLRNLYDSRGLPSAGWQTTLTQYTMTDFGSKVIGKIVAEYNQAVTDGLLDAAGDLTLIGQNPNLNPAWVKMDLNAFPGGIYRPFKFVNNVYSASRTAGRGDTGIANYSYMDDSAGFGLFAQGMTLRNTRVKNYPVNGTLGGEKIFYLAIIHHEFGHSRYGDRGADSLSAAMAPGGDKNELMAVDRYENPVRLMYGYAPRLSYTARKGTTKLLQGCSIYRAGASCP